MNTSERKKKRRRQKTIRVLVIFWLAVLLIVLLLVLLNRKNNEEDPTEPTGISEEEPSETDSSEPSSSEIDPSETDSSEPGSESTEPVVPSSLPPIPADLVIVPGDRIHYVSAADIDAIRKTYGEEPAKSGGKIIPYGSGLDAQMNPSSGRPMMADSAIQALATRGLSANFYCGNIGERKVAFSFQAGWENGYTGQILDILAAKNVKACFYITHEYAASNADLVRRMIAEGHEIGSHSYACPDAGVASWLLEDMMEDAAKMQRYMYDTFGYLMRAYNFNSSYYSYPAVALIEAMGYEVDFFSINYADYNVAETKDPARVLPALKKDCHDGAVYCFHMVNVITTEILPGLIDFCRESGYTVVPPFK